MAFSFNIPFQFLTSLFLSPNVPLLAVPWFLSSEWLFAVIRPDSQVHWPSPGNLVFACTENKIVTSKKKTDKRKRKTNEARTSYWTNFISTGWSCCRNEMFRGLTGVMQQRDVCFESKEKCWIDMQPSENKFIQIIYLKWGLGSKENCFVHKWKIWNLLSSP